MDEQHQHAIVFGVVEKAIHKTAPHKRIVFMMDCRSSNHSVQALRAIQKHGWKVLLAPSRLTSLLQPLAVYCFANFRDALSRSLARVRTESCNGHYTFLDWVEAVIPTISHTFRHANALRWFEKCGCGIPNQSTNDDTITHVGHASFGIIANCHMQTSNTS